MPEREQRVSVRDVLLFLGLTFAACWLLAGAFRLTGLKWGSLPSQVVGIVYMFGPMAAAVFVQKRVRREKVIAPLGVSFEPNRWWLAAWLGPVAVTLAALGVGLLLPGVGFSPEMAGMFERLRDLMPPDRLEKMKDGMKLFPVHPFWPVLAAGMLAGPTGNAVAGFGEELGWRGFLWRELAPLGFWKSSLLTGAIWGVWHAPLTLQGHTYPAHPVQGVLMMTAWCMLLSPLFSFIRLKSRSVVAAAVMHGTVNAVAGLAFMAVKGGSDLLVGLSGLAGFTVLAMLVLLLFIYDRLRGGRLSAGQPGFTAAR
jgi:uncharacterized protein